MNTPYPLRRGLVRLAIAPAIALASLGGPAVASAQSIEPAPPPPAPSAALCADTAGIELSRCAGMEFMAAEKELVQTLVRYEKVLSSSRRDVWRQVQNRWQAYRAEACHFEATAVTAGTAVTSLQTLCLARMTRERLAEVQQAIASATAVAR